VLIGTLLGVLNGVAINTAHELSHKPNKLEQMLSHLALAPTAYNHFRIEHPYGHHHRVATPEDPASSQMGESFGSFGRERLWAVLSRQLKLKLDV
jgi:alkane 1-monooxygenase